MNSDELIERIHNNNAVRLNSERRTVRRAVWRIAVPSIAAAAAVLLLVLWPRDSKVQAAVSTPGIYCNSHCDLDDVLALIDNNINHIKEINAL